MFLGGGFLFGLGLGGLVDGIVLHQLLQWHNVASTRLPGEDRAALEANLFWDGVFHLSTTLLLALGFALLWVAWERRGRRAGNGAALVGLIATGWGAFHVIDHVVFHELLGLHDIRDDVADPAPYNWSFFAVGIVLMALGTALFRTRGRLARPLPGGES